MATQVDILFSGYDGQLTAYETANGAQYDGQSPPEPKTAGTPAASGAVRLTSFLNREVGYLEVGHLRQPILRRRRVWRVANTALLLSAPGAARFWRLDVAAPPGAQARLDAVFAGLCHFERHMSEAEEAEADASLDAAIPEDDLPADGAAGQPSLLVQDAIRAIKQRTVPVSQAVQALEEAKTAPPTEFDSVHAPRRVSRALAIERELRHALDTTPDSPYSPDQVHRTKSPLDPTRSLDSPVDVPVLGPVMDAHVLEMPVDSVVDSRDQALDLNYNAAERNSLDQCSLDEPLDIDSREPPSDEALNYETSIPSTPVKRHGLSVSQPPLDDDLSSSLQSPLRLDESLQSSLPEPISEPELTALVAALEVADQMVSSIPNEITSSPHTPDSRLRPQVDSPSRHHLQSQVPKAQESSDVFNTSSGESQGFNTQPTVFAISEETVSKDSYNTATSPIDKMSPINPYKVGHAASPTAIQTPQKHYDRSVWDDAFADTPTREKVSAVDAIAASPVKRNESLAMMLAPVAGSISSSSTLDESLELFSVTDEDVHEPWNPAVLNFPSGSDETLHGVESFPNDIQTLSDSDIAETTVGSDVPENSESRPSNGSHPTHPMLPEPYRESLLPLMNKARWSSTVRFRHPLIPVATLAPLPGINQRQDHPIHVRDMISVGTQSLHHEVTTVGGYVGWHLMNKLPLRR